MDLEDLTEAADMVIDKTPVETESAAASQPAASASTDVTGFCNVCGDACLKLLCAECSQLKDAWVRKSIDEFARYGRTRAGKSAIDKAKVRMKQRSDTEDVILNDLKDESADQLVESGTWSFEPYLRFNDRTFLSEFRHTTNAMDVDGRWVMADTSDDGREKSLFVVDDTSPAQVWFFTKKSSVHREAAPGFQVHLRPGQARDAYKHSIESEVTSREQFYPTAETRHDFPKLSQLKQKQVLLDTSAARDQERPCPEASDDEADEHDAEEDQESDDANLPTVVLERRQEQKAAEKLAAAAKTKPKRQATGNAPIKRPRIVTSGNAGSGPQKGNPVANQLLSSLTAFAPHPSTDVGQPSAALQRLTGPSGATTAGKSAVGQTLLRSRSMPDELTGDAEFDAAPATAPSSSEAIDFTKPGSIEISSKCNAPSVASGVSQTSAAQKAIQQLYDAPAGTDIFLGLQSGTVSGHIISGALRLAANHIGVLDLTFSDLFG